MGGGVFSSVSIVFHPNYPQIKKLKDNLLSTMPSLSRAHTGEALDRRRDILQAQLVLHLPNPITATNM